MMAVSRPTGQSGNPTERRDAVCLRLPVSHSDFGEMCISAIGVGRLLTDLSVRPKDHQPGLNELKDVHYIVQDFGRMSPMGARRHRHS
jgi:hypothetical protein